MQGKINLFKQNKMTQQFTIDDDKEKQLIITGIKIFPDANKILLNCIAS